MHMSRNASNLDDTKSASIATIVDFEKCQSTTGINEVLAFLEAKDAQRRRTAKLFFGTFSLVSMFVVALLAYVVYFDNAHLNTVNNNLINTASGQPVSTGATVALTDLNSELSTVELNAVQSVEAFLVSSNKKVADVSFKPTGWARFECAEDCGDAKHVLHFFTEQGKDRTATWTS